MIRLLALFGLRPIELQHIRPKKRDDSSLGLWHSYAKNCDGALTDPRWLEPCWIRDATGEVQPWNLIGALDAGVLELPVGNGGQTRVLNDRDVEQDLRCHRHGIEVGHHRKGHGPLDCSPQQLLPLVD